MVKEVCHLLDSLGIGYECITHAPIMTVDDGRAIAERMNVVPCKNLFLVNRQEEYFLVMALGDRRVSIKDIAHRLNSSHLSFASDGDLLRLLCSGPGAVSILGLIYDKGSKVKLLIDRDIINADFILCHPCENTCSLKLKTEEVIKVLLPAINHADFEEINFDNFQY